MQNKDINNINTSTIIIVIFLLSLSILMAHSIYLLIFFSILCLILIILTEKSVKQNIYLLKKLKFWLLFIFIAYIIIFRNIIGSLLFVYKIVLILLIIKQISTSITLENLISGIDTLIKSITKKETKTISYDIALTLYFLKFYINSSEELNKKYTKRVFINKFSLKYYIFPKIFISIDKIKKLENSLKLKCYTPKFEKNSIKSNILLFVVLMLFIVVIIKEVIM